MKKIIIAAFAVMSAASFAGAGDTIDFDGGKGFAQSLHGIFAQGHQIVPEPVLQELSRTGKKIEDPFERTCCGVPIGPLDTCYMICPDDDMPDWSKSARNTSFRRLSFSAQAQEELKKAGVAYYSAIGLERLAAVFAAKESVVTVSGDTISVALMGRTYNIKDEELAAILTELESHYGSGDLRKVVAQGYAECWGPYGQQPCEVPSSEQPKSGGFAGYTKNLSNMDCLGPHGPQPCVAEMPL